MNSLIQDLRFALRMLRSSPGLLTIAVLSLAIGIGANTAVFTIVNAVLLRPLPYLDPGRLVLLSEEPQRSPMGISQRLPDRDFVALRRSARSFSSIATFAAQGMDMAGQGDPIHLASASVTADFMAALGVAPIRGRTFAASDEADDRRTAVIGASLWSDRFFSDPEIIGRMIRLDGVEHTVIGVMPPGFTFPDGAQVWTPLDVRPNPHLGFIRPVVARLKAGVSPREAQAEVQAILGPARVAIVQPFQELLVSGVRRPLLIFLGAVALVLLIACADIANLLLIGAASRVHEMAVRAAVGAGSWRLARQLMTESALLAVGAGCVGLLFTIWGLPFLLALAPEGFLPASAGIRVDGRVLVFSVGLSLLAGLLFGAAPVSHVLRRPLYASMRGADRIGERARTGLRSALVVAELAAAVVLLTAGGLMVKSFWKMRSAAPGFDAKDVLAVTVSLPEPVYRTPESRRDFTARLVEKLSTLPAVTSAGAVDLQPLGAFRLSGDARVDGGGFGTREYEVDKPCVTPGYFRSMGIRLLEGRDFSRSDNASAAPVAIVSESVVREAWPGQNAIGKRLSIGGGKTPEWLTVVGVVDDVRQYSVVSGRSSAVYRPYTQATGPVLSNEITFVLRTAIDPTLIAPTLLRKAVYQVEPTQPVASVASMRDIVARDMAEPRFQTGLLSAFSVVALLLAAVGTYGVLSFTVAARTREIGIRIALGAAARDIRRDLLRYSFTLAAFGIALGAAGAALASRVLATFLFEVKPADPTVLVSVAALLLCVAAVTVWIPARRASRVDPVVALRYE